MNDESGHAPDQRERNQNLLAGYQSLLAQTEKMLDFARKGEWPELIEEEARYVVEVERLGLLEAGLSLDRETGIRKSGLLERILEQSLEIKRHLLGRRQVLERKLESTRQRRGLARTYLKVSEPVSVGVRGGDEDSA